MVDVLSPETASTELSQFDSLQDESFKNKNSKLLHLISPGF
jgi:hypothetical protein